MSVGRAGSGLRDDALRYLQMSSILVVSIAVWELYVQMNDINPVILPSPSFTLHTIIVDLDFYLYHTWITFYETVLGFIGGVALGALSAIGIFYVGYLRRTLYPVLTTIHVVPKIAFAPLLLIWFGPTTISKVLLALLVVYFPILVNTYTGLVETEAELIELGRSFNVGEWFLFSKIRLPSAAPLVVTSLKMAVTFAVIGAVVGEFVGSQEGLGFVIVQASKQARMVDAFAAITFTALLGLVLYLIAYYIEKPLLFWYEN